MERGKDESATIHDKKIRTDRGSLRSRSAMPTTTWGTVLKEGARLTKQSEQNLNTLLNGSTELDDVARALNMLDMDGQEGIIKAAVKPVVHSFMETGKFTESQPREEETDEPNDQSDEEEELCPPLEETMAASWIAQIGEDGLSETEAVDSNELGLRPRSSRRQHERIADSSHHVQQCEIDRMVPDICDSQRVDLQLLWTETEHRKIFVLDCARKTCVFAARRRVTGRLNVQRNNTTRMELLPPSSQD